MVEQIKCIHTKLHARFFSHLGVLVERQVDILEARSDDHVAPETSEARRDLEEAAGRRGSTSGGRKVLRVAIGRRADADRHRPENIRADRVGRAGVSAGSDDFDGVSALQLIDEREVPSNERELAN